jgi:hypothetical protein
MATKAQRHKAKLFAKKLIFVFWCLGGENVFVQNVVDSPLEDKEFTNKTLNSEERIAKWRFQFKDCGY